MGWNRKLWGVEFTGGNGIDGDDPVLIGTHWTKTPLERGDEPTRALLFYTREKAREWCKEKMAEYDGRNDCCAQWMFRPVRVQETVIKVLNVD